MLDYTVFNIAQNYDGYIQFTYRKKSKPNELKIKTDNKFLPYFYIPVSQKHNISKIKNSNLVRKIVNSDFLTLVRKEKTFKIYTKRSIDVREVRENFNETYEADVIFTRRWMIDNYYDKEMANLEPRICFMDIEVSKPERGFPNYKLPNQPITAITVYDNYTKKFYTFSFKKGISIKDRNKGIFIFNTEKEMLEGFLRWWFIHIPDILTGWNVIQFDLNYLYYRLIRLFKKDTIHRIISPFHYITQGETRDRFGRNQESIEIKGLFVIDYLNLYRRSNQQMKENYKLDYIAEMELDKKKISYEGTLDDLYEKDFTKFLKYNRNDVRLNKELDDKFKLISLLDYIRRYSRTLYTDYDFTSAICDGYLLCEAKLQKIVLPTARKDIDRSDLPGAFVCEPQIGLKSWICGYDLNALYPNIIKTINISPETKLGHKDELNLDKLENIALAGNGIVFNKEEVGFIPAAITKLVDVRTKTKAKALELKRNGNDFEAESLDKLQKALKIIANGTYGYLSFKSSRFFDMDMASAITLTGQELIKFLIENVNNYLNKTYNTKTDYIVGGDTDSIYVSIQPILDKLKSWNQKSEKDKIRIISKISLNIQKNINNKLLDIFAREKCLTKSHFFKIKREIIGKTGIFIAKKRYVIWIINEEGKKVNKLKKVGLDIVRSNINKEIKNKLEEIIWDILKRKTNQEINKEVRKLLQNIRKLPIKEIALPIGVSKTLEEYGKGENKSIPMHIRGAIWYNNFIDKDKFQKIDAGDKILYLPIIKEKSKNILGERIHVISFLDKCPVDEKEIRKIIDWDKVEKRNIISPLESIYEGLKWSLPGQKAKTSLFDFI